MSKVIHPGFAVLCISVAIASLAMLIHGLGMHRQPDAHMTTAAFELMAALREGDIARELLALRKYPLLPSLILAPAYAVSLGVLLVTGRISSVEAIPAYIFLQPAMIDLVGRVIVLGTGILTLVLLWRISRRLFPGIPPWAAPLLLLSSVLVVTYATAVRPHLPVAFATLLTFMLSMRLAERKTLPRVLLAFGAAVAAFSTLQSGFFAFLFPVWGFLTVDQRIRWRRLRHPQFLFLVLASVAASSLVGYPFLWNLILGRPIDLGFDLGHNYLAGQSRWTGAGFLVLLRTLLGSELFLASFATAGVVLWWRGRARVPAVTIVLTYLALYTIAFGLYAGSSPRFFLPILPFLAILGAPVLASRRVLSWGIVAVTVLLHLQIASIALRPDTYDLATAFLRTQTEGTIASAVPDYVLGIPPTRASITPPEGAREAYIASLPADLPDARPFVSWLDRRNADAVLATGTEAQGLGPRFRVCHRIAASRTGDASFSWSEIDWPLLRLWTTRHMGPSITIECRS